MSIKRIVSLTEDLRGGITGTILPSAVLLANMLAINDKIVQIIIIIIVVEFLVCDLQNSQWRIKQ